MTTAAELRHEVSAYNLSAASENKIHDDSVAKKFGFEGGLVPGVEVYAYMTHLPVTHFGPDWLTRGGAEARLRKPVYDGRQAVAAATIEADGALAMTVKMDDLLCATGRADMPLEMAPPPVDDILAVLDGLGIEKAHIVGLSMGGFAALHFGVVLREEDYLECKFGEPYLLYKQAVSRWV